MEGSLRPYVVEGFLSLVVQEGGFAADEFVLDPSEETTLQPYPALFNRNCTEFQLSEAIAQHFGVARRKGQDRCFGKVRITIESLDDGGEQ